MVPLLVGDEASGDAHGCGAAGRRHLRGRRQSSPAVALHQCRLRFIMNARHTRAQIDRVLDVLATLAPSYVDRGPVRRTGSDKPRARAYTASRCHQASRATRWPRSPASRIATTSGITQPIDPDQSLRTDLNLTHGPGHRGRWPGRPLRRTVDTPEASDIDSVRDLLEYVARHATPEAAG